MNRLLAIVGPTAIGKTQLSLRLAQNFNAEIVSADSRQLYRHMDIGTAKPIREELSLVPHYLINTINPDEDFSLAQYQQLTYSAINDIHKRNKLPILVGGSGMYIWAVLEGWGVPKVPPNRTLRRSLEEKAAVESGREELYQELATVDPVATQRIDPRNVRRVIRALEVYKETGTKFSQLQQKNPPDYDIFIIGLTTNREELYRRIDQRVDKMLEEGLIAEVEKLTNMGYGFDLPAMSALGYKEISMFLRGGLTLESAIQQMKFETHRFARYQYSWFRLKDVRINWLDIQRAADGEVMELLLAFMKE
ncbi:tRNA (adenosine(37)-N6)-dimethylallyltransferase MiaA [Chloroflexota bacterium]